MKAGKDRDPVRDARGRDGVQLGMEMTQGIRSGELSVITSSKIKLRENAALICLHRCNLWHGKTDDLPFGDVETLARWCADEIGPRYVDWYYRGGGTWCFRELEDMILFQMTWK